MRSDSFGEEYPIGCPHDMPWGNCCGIPDQRPAVHVSATYDINDTNRSLAAVEVLGKFYKRGEEVPAEFRAQVIDALLAEVGKLRGYERPKLYNDFWIRVIKHLRDLRGLGLKECRELVDRYRANFQGPLPQDFMIDRIYVADIEAYWKLAKSVATEILNQHDDNMEEAAFATGYTEL